MNSKFVIVGLPGSGKSTVCGYILQNICKGKVAPVSTDKAVLQARQNHDFPVTKKYIENFEKNYGEKLDLEVFSLENDGAFIKKHGETAFRDFEEAVIIDMFENNKFKGKYPDLGGAAFMRENTRRAIKKNKYLSIYLKVSPEVIGDYLYKDYMESKAAGVVKRGNYTTCADDAAAEGRDVREALVEFSQKHRKERETIYEKADIVVYVNKKEEAANVAMEIMDAVKKHGEIERRGFYNMSLRKKKQSAK
ncbi:MAG: hypothetical protein LBR70_01170 [Lactobacillaceae bacterium]|nr:hypothetical protein [Lactobacillaceae bacterium]